MEEILSSIRRIIADEDAHEDAADDELEAAEAPSESDAQGFAQGAEHDEEDVLELTRVVREGGEVVELQTERSSLDAAIEAPEPAAPAFAGYGADQTLALEGEEPRGAIDHAPQIEDEQVPSEKARNSELVSGAAATMATGAFTKLSQALQRTPEEESVADGSGRTVEQFFEDIAPPCSRNGSTSTCPRSSSAWCRRRSRRSRGAPS